MSANLDDAIAAYQRRKGKARKPIRESQIEDALRERVKSLGGIAFKFTSPQRRGVPDRLVLMPGGVIAFVELKKPGEKPTSNQLREHERIRALGFRVDVVDDLDVAKNWSPEVDLFQ